MSIGTRFFIKFSLLFVLSIGTSAVKKEGLRKEDRYKNGPSFIFTPFGKEMVDKWMEGD